MDADAHTLTARRDAILSEIRQILITNLDVRREPDEIDPDTPLFGSGLGLDSVDAIEILVSLEQAFGVTIPNETAGRAAMRTVNTLVDLVMEENCRGL
jgi:acyl carrier protein